MRARDNPFAADRVLKVRYRPQGWTWDGLMERLAALRYRGAIVGPHGSGKTTLLEDLEPKLIALGFEPARLRLDRETRTFQQGYLDEFFRRTTPRHLILIDGAEQMTRLAWRLFRRRARRAGGLIVTSHRAGLLPTLVECATTPELLDEVIGELANGSAPDVAVHELFARHRGNLRDAIRELYDRCASQ